MMMYLVRVEGVADMATKFKQNIHSSRNGDSNLTLNGDCLLINLPKLSSGLMACFYLMLFDRGS